MTPPEHRFEATTRRGTGLAVSPRHSGWVVLLLLAGMPAALLVLFAGEQSSPWIEVGSLWTWVRIGAEFLLAAAVHEAGHLAAGSIGGMRWGLFAVGPVIVRRYGAKVRLGWNRLALWGGASALTAPPGTVDDLVTGVRWAVAGGPAVSLVAGIAAWMAGHPLAPFTLASLGIGLVTLAPVGAGTDGARLLRLARGGKSARAEAAFVALAAEFLVGGPPSSWDARWVAAALDAPNPGRQGDARALAYYHALDTGDAEAAGNHLRYFLEHPDGLSKLARATLLPLEAAYFEGAWRGDVDAARAWLARAGRVPRGARPLQLRAEAAVALAAGEVEEALRRIREARAHTPAGGGGMAVLQDRLLDRLEGSARAAL